MGNTVIIKKFKELGLSPYEAKSYLSLLEKDTLTVSEIARLAGIPRANAYEALEKLLAKGFCVSRPGKVRQYSALDPTQLEEKTVLVLDQTFENKFKKLYEKQDELLNEKKSARQNLNDLIKELTPLYKNSRSKENPIEYIEIIKDSYQMNKRFLELINEAKHEILGFSKRPFSVPDEKVPEQENGQAESLRRGIDIRAIYGMPVGREEMEWRLKLIDKQAKQGEKARVIKQLPMKMAIFDEKIVILALEDPISLETSFTTQIITHPDLAKTLKITFETLWEQAEDYHVLEGLLKNM